MTISGHSSSSEEKKVLSGEEEAEPRTSHDGLSLLMLTR